MKIEGLKINFLGDSITKGVGTSCSDMIYHTQLKVKANLKEINNYGVSGTRLAKQQFSDDCASSFCDRFIHMSDDADIVVVFGGTNDYGHGDALLGCFSDKTPDTFYGACHYLFRGLIKKYIGKPVVIMTPLHRTDENQKNATSNGVLKDYINIIREVAEYYSLPLLDLFSGSGIQPEISEIQEMYMPDGLHPNDNGHSVIAHKLQMFLEQL